MDGRTVTRRRNTTHQCDGQDVVIPPEPSCLPVLAVQPQAEKDGSEGRESPDDDSGARPEIVGGQSAHHGEVGRESRVP